MGIKSVQLNITNHLFLIVIEIRFEFYLAFAWFYRNSIFWWNYGYLGQKNKRKGEETLPKEEKRNHTIFGSAQLEKKKKKDPHLYTPKSIHPSFSLKLTVAKIFCIRL